MDSATIDRIAHSWGIGAEHACVMFRTFSSPHSQQRLLRCVTQRLSNAELLRRTPATATLLRPFKVKRGEKDSAKTAAPAKTNYETQVRQYTVLVPMGSGTLAQMDLKTRLRSMLENEKLIPRVRALLRTVSGVI